MTSAEIQKYMDDVGNEWAKPNWDEHAWKFEHWNILAEIAYQLAVANEARAAQEDSGSKADLHAIFQGNKL